MEYPDYNRSLLSLISSILENYGVATPHRTLPEMDRLLAKGYKNVLVMLFDGLGPTILEKHLPPNAFLRKHLATSISSVFPATTTAATITMETGLAPIEHGWLGWSLFFEEIGANVSVFPNTLSGTDGRPAADYNIARRYLPYESIFDKIKTGTAGTVGTYCISPYSAYRSQSLKEVCATAEDLCGRPQRKYIYTYWPQPDYDMHELGTAASQVKASVEEINAAVESLSNRVKDTLIVVTADHGLVDTKWRYISDCPAVGQCLVRPPSIETRAMSFFVKPEYKEQFAAAFEKYFGDGYVLFTRQQVLERELFGQGTPHPRAGGFIGDYIGVATGPFSIDYSLAPAGQEFEAAHAGMTEEEMRVPLIVVVRE